MTQTSNEEHHHQPDDMMAPTNTAHVDRPKRHTSILIYDIVTDSITQWGHEIIEKYMKI